MTSNYGQYIHPELWPVPVEQIRSVHTGWITPDWRKEICAWVRRDWRNDYELHVLDRVPLEVADAVVREVTEYVRACRKLTGQS